MIGPREILSVGHNPTLLMHRHSLLKHAGYSVVSAAHPVKAMNLLATRNFDLIVVGLSAHSERVLIERLTHQNHVAVIFLCCDKFDPAGRCSCERAQLTSQELLQKVATTLSNGLTH